jgi:hypothetical protein
MTRHRLARAIALASLTGRAWLALVAFDLARLAGFARVHAILTRSRPSPRRSSVTETDVVRAVDEACVWYVRRAACLQRSAVAAWLLRRHGFAADLVIGCRPLPFESHAWVELDGRVVNDRPQYQKVFRVLDRM